MTTEMDYSWRAEGISRLERKRNERVREIHMGVDGNTIIKDIRKKQLIWYGHVKRTEEERLPK
jgi:hypothetical protein